MPSNRAGPEMGWQCASQAVLIHQEDKAFVPGNGHSLDGIASGSVEGGKTHLDLWDVRLVLGPRRGQRRGGAVGAHDERRGWQPRTKRSSWTNRRFSCLHCGTDM